MKRTGPGLRGPPRDRADICSTEQRVQLATLGVPAKSAKETPMFASLAQAVAPTLRSTGLFMKPAIQAGARDAIKVISTSAVIYGGILVTGAAGYGLYRGGRAASRGVTRTARRTYTWATSRSKAKRTYRSSIDDLIKATTETDTKPLQVNDHVIGIPVTS